jgi:hypothetical protein
MKKYAVVLCLLFALNSVSHAIDFGLIVDQSAGYGGGGDDAAADYTAAFVPRFSALIGDTADIYVSAGFIIEYERDVIRFVPELLRTEFTWLFGIGDLKAGRIYYSDPLGFIANGLFDGARVSIPTDFGTFSAAAVYTGLLYKRRANITMTPQEAEAYALEPDFNDFAGTYFAPGRVAAALEWEHLSLGGPLQVRAAVLGQFDTGGGLHSQYIAAKIALPLRAIAFDLGACLELIQNDGTFETAAAAELGLYAALPTPLQDRLSFTARYSSGAFLPLTTREQGDILKAKLSGLSLVSLDYTARLFPAFSAGIGATYFIRSDLETYTAYPITGDSDGYLLGNEFFVRLMWSPFSDLQINLGGGIFLPSMGDAAPDADAAWRIELNLIFGL